jgi:hypothetical protein
VANSLHNERLVGESRQRFNLFGVGKMKNVLFGFMIAVALVACSSSNSNDVARKDGWTASQIEKSTSECSTNLRTSVASQEAADKICGCHIQSISQKLTFEIFSAPRHNSETLKILEEDFAACEKQI